ncbi:MAG: insulinase family protein [Planctomycetota bacterium]|nr:MAG: insulinase family protein [Planctomycetota bacterium]
MYEIQLPLQQRETLENGLRLVLLRLPHLRSVSVRVGVPAGVLYEERSVNGISHFLEHLHLSASRNYPDRDAFNQQWRQIAGVRDGVTEPDFLQLAFLTAPRHTTKLIELVTEVMAPGHFSDELIEAERTLILSELAGTDASFKLPGVAGDAEYARPPAGTLKSVARLRPSEIHEWDRRLFDPRRMVVVIAGGFSEQDVEHARESFGTLRTSSASPPPRRASSPKLSLPDIRAGETRDQMPTLWLGWVMPPNASPQCRAATLFLSHVMDAPTAPLWEAVRYQATSVYHWSVDEMRVGDLRYLWVESALPGRQRNSLVRTLLEIFRDLCEPAGAREWFDHAHMNFLFGIERSFDEPHALAARILSEEIVNDGGPPFAEIIDAVRRMTPESLAASLRQIMVPERFFLHYTARRPHWLQFGLRRILAQAGIR